MLSNKPNYYDILKVDINCDLETIRNSYRNLAKKYHPDTCKMLDKKDAEEMLKLINEAYDILSDAKKKKEYDEQLHAKQAAIVNPVNANSNSSNSPAGCTAGSGTSHAKKSSFHSLNFDEINQYSPQQRAYNYDYNKHNSATEKAMLLLKFGIVTIVLVIIIFFGIFTDKSMRNSPNDNAEQTNPNVIPNSNIKGDNKEITAMKMEKNFTIGSTDLKVKSIMGKPDAISKSLWMYGDSDVYFDKNRKVIGWDNVDNNLKVFLYNKVKGAPPLRLGSTKLDVKKALGTPTYIYLNVWKYGSLEIRFDSKGIVKGWINRGKNLRSLSYICSNK